MKPLPVSGVVSSLFLLAAAVAAPAVAQEPRPPGPRPPAPAEEVGRKVGWQEALDQALARNPSAVVALQEIARADALVREARAAWLPTLTGNASYTRIDTARVLNGTVATPADSWNANLQLTVPILAPRAWADDWHAQSNRQVATLNAADIRRQLAAAVGRAYLAVLLQHRQIEVAVRARANAEAHFQYARTRLQGGLGNSIDDARAEQELRSDEAQVGIAQAALVRAQSALGILLSEEQLVDAAEEVNLAAAPDAASAVEQARKSRSDLQVASARLEASRQLHRDVWAYYAPSLLGIAQVFAQRQTALQPPHGWQAQLVLSLPLFDGGLRYGVTRERRALEAESRVQWEAAMRQVSVEVRSAFSVVQRTDESLRAAQASAAVAGNAARLADQAYRAGATTNLEVIDAERRARDAATQAAFAEDAARQARLDLLLASGRFP